MKMSFGLTVSSVPAIAPASNSCLIPWPGKTKNGGICCPRAFPHPITVTVSPFQGVTAGGGASLEPSPIRILGGE